MADRLELSKAHQRMQEALQDPGLIDQFCYRVAEGETPKEICDSWRLPYGLFSKWIAEDETRKARYETALELRADAIAHESIQIADAAEDVAKAKLQVDTRTKMAGKWDRKRYGEAQDNVGAALIGGLASAIIEAHKRLEAVERPKVIPHLEGEFVEVKENPR